MMVKKKTTKAQKRSFGKEGDIYGLNGGDGFRGVHLSQTHRVVHIEYEQLHTCQTWRTKLLTIFKMLNFTNIKLIVSIRAWYSG